MPSAWGDHGAILAWATRRPGNGGRGVAAGRRGEGSLCPRAAERCPVPPPVPPTPPRCRVPGRPTLPVAGALPRRVADLIPVTLHSTPPRSRPRGPRARPQFPVAPPGTSETAGAQADVSPRDQRGRQAPYVCPLLRLNSCHTHHLCLTAVESFAGICLQTPG